MANLAFFEERKRCVQKKMLVFFYWKGPVVPGSSFLLGTFKLYARPSISILLQGEYCTSFLPFAMHIDLNTVVPTDIRAKRI